MTTDANYVHIVFELQMLTISTKMSNMWCLITIWKLVKGETNYHKDDLNWYLFQMHMEVSEIVMIKVINVKKVTIILLFLLSLQSKAEVSM